MGQGTVLVCQDTVPLAESRIRCANQDGSYRDFQYINRQAFSKFMKLTVRGITFDKGVKRRDLELKSDSGKVTKTSVWDCEYIDKKRMSTNKKNKKKSTRFIVKLKMDKET